MQLQIKNFHLIYFKVHIIDFLKTEHAVGVRRYTIRKILNIQL